MEIKSRADAQATVQTHAEQVAAQVGAALTNPSLAPGPCTGRDGGSGDDIFTMQGAYQIPLPQGQHTATAAKVRDSWKAAGWTITDDRTNGASAVLTATTTDGYYIDLESTTPPKALALIIRSPCFQASA